MPNVDTTKFDTIVADALKGIGVEDRNINPESSKQIPPAESLPGHSPSTPGTLKGPTKDTEFINDEPKPKEEVKAEPKEEKSSTQKQSEAELKVEAIMETYTRKITSMLDKREAKIQAMLQSAIAPVSQLLTKQEEAELADLPPDEQVKRRMDKMELQLRNGFKPTVNPTQPIDSQPEAFVTVIANAIQELGLDPADKRIVWGGDASTPKEGFKQFLSSIRKIDAETHQAEIKKLRTEFDSAVKKIRRQVGLDRTPSSGAGGSGQVLTGKETPSELIQIGLKQHAEQNSD